MQKIAFTMQLHPGQKGEYIHRHETIWPELKNLLVDAGISDYTIFLDEETDILFAVLKRTNNHAMDTLPDSEIMRRWWEYMAPIMMTNEDNSPVVRSLEQVFHMD